MSADSAIDLKKTLAMQTGIIVLGAGLSEISGIKIELWGTLGVGAILWGLLAAFASLLTVAVPVLMPDSTIGKKFQEIYLVVSSLMRGLSWLSIIVISLLAGVGEELLFRAFLQVWVGDLTHYALGIFVSALIFGLLHFLSLLYFAIAMTLGLLFSWGYYATQSLLFIAVWHASYDFLVLALLVKFPHWLSIANEGREGAEAQADTEA